MPGTGPAYSLRAFQGDCPLRYVSTRGTARPLGFEEALIAGLAEDGGLYLPETWPSLSPDALRDMAGAPYAEIACQVISPFVGGDIPPDRLAAMVQDAYAGFDHAAVAPLRQLDAGLWLLELFHGPTLSFKDYALQLVGRLFDHALARRGERVTVIGATSGDTGSAAIEALQGSRQVEVFILHPKGRVSDVQRRQMTTVDAPNIHNIAIEGTFDDCQDLVKAMFADAPFRTRHRLSAVNSINWARIVCQTAFYVVAAVALGAPDRQVAFAVPTGNFGNVFAGWVARKMGLPIAQLIIGSNRNDILTRFVETGEMRMRPVEPSLSPAMDIQVSSNFERLLFELWGRDGARVAKTMDRFRKTGAFQGDNALIAGMRGAFDAARLDDDATLAVIRDIHATTGTLVDPHTAIGIHAARARRRDPRVPTICIATAHPAKFPDAVEKASGIRPDLPARLAGLFERPELCDTLPKDLAAVKKHIATHATLKGAA